MAQVFLVKKVPAQYPADVNVQGTVILQAVVDTDGSVEQLKVISGNPMLVPNAIEAARQYKYKTYYLNRQPVEFETQISIPFVPPKKK